MITQPPHDEVGRYQVQCSLSQKRDESAGPCTPDSDRHQAGATDEAAVDGVKHGAPPARVNKGKGPAGRPAFGPSRVLDGCGQFGHRRWMNELLVGYARVSTEQQDLTSQRNGLHALGVGDDRIYVDHGLTGTNRERPGLTLALAACRAGDTSVVTKLDRLARSLPDARDILDELTKRNVKLSLGGSIHDPTDPVGRLLFNVLAMVAEFESDLIRLRTREGMKVAKRKAGSVAGSQS